ncbi:MAG: hypothetical protein PUP92_19375, partial [Rhizonema sp. PD38]|nr:hypothetical protein [Rhizonema sp. PD38]
MSNSCNVAEQREKEEKVLRSFLVLSFIGSAVLHIAILTLGSLWFKTPKLAEKPIEIILVDEPSTPKAVKIKQNTPPKDKPVAINRTTPQFKTITKSLTSGAAIRAIASGGKSGSGTNSTPSKLLSNPDASIPSIKQNTTVRTQSKPFKTPSQPKSVVALKPKPNLSPLDPIPPLPSPEPTPIPPLPKIVETSPPLPSPEPTPIAPLPKVVETSPPLPTLKPTPIPPLPTV